MDNLFLSPGIRYTCIRCGACCRSLEVTLTEAEHELLAKHDWTTEVPDATPARLFARIRGARGKQVWRLRPQPSGACAFLTDDNLCRVHSRLGYAAKPFAGRLFPFSLVVTPVGVFVGCRFNCPAVVRGIGADIEQQRGEIKRLFEEYARTYTPPSEGGEVRFFARYKLGWRDVLGIEDQLLAFLLVPDLAVPRRLFACWLLVRQFVSQAVRPREGQRVGADPQAVLERARAAETGRKLSAMERLMLRLTVAAFVGASPHAVRERSLVGRLGTRLGNLWRRCKMAAGRGRVRLPGIEGCVRLRDVASLDLAALDAASAEMLQRYLVAKLTSQEFFGVACFGRSFAEGFEFLALSYVAILWLAGAHALGAGRRQVESADVEYGIRTVDFGYNYLGELGGFAARSRSALLWHWDTAGKALLSFSGRKSGGGSPS